jgi:hypothetical protein
MELMMSLESQLNPFWFSSPRLRVLAISMAFALITSLATGGAPAKGDVVFFGFVNQPLGNAQLNVLGGNLVVSNIGSSGQDGVRQIMPGSGTQAMQTNLGLPNFSMSSAGTKLFTTQIGVVDGISNQLFSSFSIENVPVETAPSILKLAADFSFVGATSYSIDLFNGSQLVTRQTGLSTGEMFAPPVDFEGLDCKVGKDGKEEITGKTDGPVSITIADRGTFFADNWVIENEDFTRIATAQEFIEMFGTNTGPLTITAEFSDPPPAGFPPPPGFGVPEPSTLTLFGPWLSFVLVGYRLATSSRRRGRKYRARFALDPENETVS